MSCFVQTLDADFFSAIGEIKNVGQLFSSEAINTNINSNNIHSHLVSMKTRNQELQSARMLALLECYSWARLDWDLITSRCRLVLKQVRAAGINKWPDATGTNKCLLPAQIRGCCRHEQVVAVGTNECLPHCCPIANPGFELLENIQSILYTLLQQLNFSGIAIEFVMIKYGFNSNKENRNKTKR